MKIAIRCLSRPIFGLACAAVLAGCGSFQPKKDVAVGTMQGARTMIRSECVIANKSDYDNIILSSGGPEAGMLAGLLSSLAPSIVEKLVDFVAAYAEKRGREYSSTSTAAGSAALPPGPRKGCLIYVAGAFGDSAKADGEWTADKLRSLGLTRRPDVYVEWIVHTRDSGGRNLTITPVHLDFQKPQSIRTSGEARKNLSFVVELSAPTDSPPAALGQSGPPAAVPAGGAAQAAAKPSPATPISSAGKTLAAFPVTFGEINVGSKFGPVALTGLTAPMQVIDKSQYVNLLVTAVETEDGGDFLLTFAEFITKNKSKISEKLTTGLQKAVGGDSANAKE
jgi:hypothetical protein